MGILQAAINIAGVVLSVIVAAGLVFFGFMWSIYDLSNALPFLACIPAFGLIFGFPMIFLLREKKGIMQELRSRFKKPEDMANIEATIKKKSRKSLIVMIGIILLALIVVLGMVLSGTVRNVIDFGVFVDIGVHQDGLVHISQVCNRKIKHPSEILKVGDVVKVAVLEVDEKRKRISLTIKGVPKE